MATEARAVFLTAELTMVGGVSLAVAPLYPEIRWIGEDQRAVSARFSKVAEASWSRRGELLPWLEAVGPAAVVADRIEVRFPPSTKPPQPELILHFDALLADTVGWVPALGIAAWSAAPEGLREALVANIRLEFARNKRLRAGRSVLETQWFQAAVHDVAEVAAHFYTFHEIRAFAEDRKQALLPRMATRIRGSAAGVFEVEDLVGRLGRAVKGGATNLLLVGPSGVGKSTVLQAFFAQQELPVWETTASRMERALTEGSGWQENLATVVAELRESGDILFVRNLAELFEVGRYVGNQTSMGEFLRTALQNGELRLMTECTEAERGRIDSRYPGVLGLFHTVDVPEPDAEAMDRLLARSAETIAGDRLPVDTARRVLALQRRFTPYSGFPGKTVRFLEHLARAETGPLGPGTAIRRFCAESGLPPMILDPEEELSVDAIRAHFASRIEGQQAAVDAVVDTLISVKTQTTRRGKPIASLLFAGPTGVGKTETAKALASFLFGGADRMLRFDMSEFSSPGAVLRLAGAGEGLLTSAVRRTPFCVLLFDEIEKADPSFFDLLLQVLGEGRLTDSRGRLTDFCSAVVVMTSNLGADRASRSRPGFGGGPDATELHQAYTDAVTSWFRPELVNRIDRILPFAALSRASIRNILDLRLKGLAERAGLQERRVHLALPDAVRDHLAEVGTHPAYGARQLNRELAERVLAPVAEVLNGDPDGRPLTVEFAVEDGALVVHPRFDDEDASAVARAEGLRELCVQTTTARRRAWSVHHGAGFARLQSALHILERRKQRLGKDFWKRSADVARHGRLTDLIADAEACFAAIDDLEEQVALDALVDRDAAHATHRTAHDAQVKASRALYRRLYQFLNPDETALCLGVYGPRERVVEEADRYQRLAEVLDFEVKRFDAALFRREDDDVVVVQTPPGPDDGLVPVRELGVELRIAGPGVHHALGEQNGLIEIVGSGGAREVLRVSAQPPVGDGWSRPAELHRRAAYANQPTLRTLTPDRVKGTGLTGPRKGYAERLERLVVRVYWARLLQELAD